MTDVRHERIIILQPGEVAVTFNDRLDHVVYTEPTDGECSMAQKLVLSLLVALTHHSDQLAHWLAEQTEEW